MKNSLFTRAYQYRERRDHNNLENYLIEVFSFCLENDWDIYKYKNINSFIASNEDHIPEMSEFLKNNLEELLQLKKLDSKVFM